MKTLEVLLKTEYGEKAEGIQKKLQKYMQLILEWNEKINLTAITGNEAFEEKHILDSLSPLLFSDGEETFRIKEEFKNAKRIIDVGTGGGFPGVPLAACLEDAEFVLLDSVRKKLNAVVDATDKSNIRNVCAVHARAEDLAKSNEHREKYDICVSRAVASLPVLAELCLPFVKKGGIFVAYKGDKAAEEEKAATKAIEVLKGRVEKRYRPGSASGHELIVIRKTGTTPRKYPRKAGTPSKNPIL